MQTSLNKSFPLLAGIKNENKIEIPSDES